MFGTPHSRKEGVTYRISREQEVSMRSLAAMLDIGGFITMCTGVGEIATEAMGIGGDIYFIYTFYRKGVNFGRTKGAMGTVVANSVAEVIPFLNGFYPGFTIEVDRLVELVCKEDEELAEQDSVTQQTQQIAQFRLMRAAQIREQQLQQRALEDAEETV